MTCLYCGGPLNYAGTGRVPVFCSNAHRQAMYRFRQNGFQRVRKSRALRAINDLSLRNAGGAVYRQVDWTV